MPSKFVSRTVSRTRWATGERYRAWCSTRISPSLGFAFVLAAAFALSLRPAPTSGPFARDFEAYYAAGALWNAGGDAYGRDIWRFERTIPGVNASHEEVLPYVGPAAALPLWSLFARLPFGVARALWLGLLVVALGALVAASLALTGEPLTLGRTCEALALAAASGPVVSAVALGQAALLGAAATIATLLALERRSRWAIVTACVAAIQPNIALSLAARALDRRACAVLAGAAAVVCAIALAAGGGAAGLLAYAHRLAMHGAAERFISIQYTVPAIAWSFGASPAGAAALSFATSLTALAVVVCAVIRLHRTPLVGTCVAVALLPFAVPFFHEHDFIIELFPLLLVLRRGNARVRAIAGIAAAMTLVDWFGLAQRPPALVQTVCLAFAVAFACGRLGSAGRTEDTAERVAMLTPLGATCVLLAGCVPLAHAFGAPVWPDALGAFHAVAGTDISRVWGDEQRAAGLTAVVPAWGLLRSVPLAGCLILAWTSVQLRDGAPAQAMKTTPSRMLSATLASESPVHGPTSQ